MSAKQSAGVVDGGRCAVDGRHGDHERGPDALNSTDDFATTGGTALRWDSTGQQWIQNWATPTSGKGSCYLVTMTTQDGSSISAQFQLK